MDIKINGEVNSFDKAALTVAELLQALGLAENGIAVARNQEIVPRSAYPHVDIQTGDKIDIVHAIGGG